ncbi:MAG: hypothetical protein FWC26_08090 [Fibromonadales bacterium]|nr:hypothetical protein [Fibromonadales bacterium]
MRQDFKISYNGDWKYFCSPDYNYSFNLKNGTFARWGATEKDDPEFSTFGPEILDFEITEICAGFCPYCYKDNKPYGKNTFFETFKSVVEKINPNRTLTQVAFGLGMTGKEIFANSVFYLTQYGLKQTNCHFVLAQETIFTLYELIELAKTDSRLSKLNAIVLLSIKQCGRAAKGNFHIFSILSL